MLYLFYLSVVAFTSVMGQNNWDMSSPDVPANFFGAGSSSSSTSTQQQTSSNRNAQQQVAQQQVLSTSTVFKNPQDCPMSMMGQQPGDSCTLSANIVCQYDLFCCCPEEQDPKDQICVMVNNLACENGKWVMFETLPPPQCIIDPDFICKSDISNTQQQIQGSNQGNTQIQQRQCVQCPEILPDCDASCVEPSFCQYMDRTCETCHQAICQAPLTCTTQQKAQCPAVTCNTAMDEVSWTPPDSCCPVCMPRECMRHSECASGFCMKAVGDCQGIGICIPAPDSTICAQIGNDQRVHCSCSGTEVVGLCNTHALKLNVLMEGQCPAGVKTLTSTAAPFISTTTRPVTTTTLRQQFTTGFFQPFTTSTTRAPTTTTTTTRAPTTTTTTTRAPTTTTRASTTTTTTKTTTPAPQNCQYSLNCNGKSCSGDCNGGEGVKHCDVVNFRPPMNGGTCDINNASMKKTVSCVNQEPCLVAQDCTWARDCSNAVCNAACGGGQGWKECVVTNFVPAKNGGSCTKQGNGEIILRTCRNTMPCPADCTFDLECMGQCNGPCGGNVGTTMCRVKNYKPAQPGGDCSLPYNVAEGSLIPQTCTTPSCQAPRDCVVTLDCASSKCSGTCGGGFGVRSCVVSEFIPAQSGGFCSVSGLGEEVSQPCQNLDPCPDSAPTFNANSAEAIINPTEGVFFSTHSAIVDIQGIYHPTEAVKEFGFYVYWHQNNVEEFSKAMKLREHIVDLVEKGNFVAVLDGINRNKMSALSPSAYVPKVEIEPVGPHPAAHFEIWAPIESYGQLMSIFMLHRGELSILSVPHTRWELEDFTGRAVWIGPQWRIDTSALRIDLGKAPVSYPELGMGYSA